MFAWLVTSCQQVWNKLLTTCNKFVDIVRLVTRLFQQGCYNHDITILLQPCVVNLVTSCCVMTVSDLLEQLVTSLIMPSSLLQVVNNLFQTCYNKSGTSSANTTCEQTCYNLFADLFQLVCRFVTTCAFLRVYEVEQNSV